MLTIELERKQMLMEISKLYNILLKEKDKVQMKQDKKRRRKQHRRIKKINHIYTDDYMNYQKSQRQLKKLKILYEQLFREKIEISKIDATKLISKVIKKESIKEKVEKRHNIKVIDIDISARYISEWAEIFYFKIVNLYDVGNIKVNEYKFAWLIENQLNYYLLNNPLAEQNEIRLKLLYLDMIRNASDMEKQILQHRFIVTDFVRKQMKNINC